MRSVLLVLVMTIGVVSARAQLFETSDSCNFSEGKASENVLVADGFWKNWFVQMDLDMTLQNPYGYKFRDVIPNGVSFGIDFAVGKWFSHQVGMRGKFNWENKLPLLKNNKANWLAPFCEPGVNRDKGGYIALYGDILVNVHNLLCTYKPDRTWNISVYPRIGVNYNFGVDKGSLTAGFGFLNTYRIDNHWSLLADIAYTMTGSGFVGINESGGTGTGSNANGYFTIGLGAQYDLGITDTRNHGTLGLKKTGVLTNGIWDNWFVQAGFDMSLIKPYKFDFSKVFPKGMTFGLNASFGKWFTPEWALRGRLQWENGLIPNNGLEWVPPVDDPKQNYKNGGLATMTLDAMLNLTNAIIGYDSQKKWHTTAYLRAGLITQFVESSMSPLMGVGLEETYRLNDKLSLFGSAGYQVSTSEGMGYVSRTDEASTGSNGFFDIDLGIRYDIGRNTFYNNIAEKRKAYLQPQTGHNWPRFLVNTALSVGVAYSAKSALKAIVKEERPDHSDNQSFPSGHASMAFAAARSIDKEFRKDCVWIPIAGYAAATAIGVERVASDRHHWYDVVAGAALGYGSAELSWWASNKLFGKGSNVAVGTSGKTLDLIYNF